MTKRPNSSTGPWHVGDASIRFLVDIDCFPMRLDFIFPQADRQRFAAEMDWLEPDFIRGGDLLIAIQSALVEIDGKVILVDTCVGEDKSRPVRPDWNNRKASGYLERLAECGYRPEDIDYVFCTHLHADHVGWNTRLVDGRWVPTFPNARYLMGQFEYAYWQSKRAAEGAEPNHGSFADSVLPVVEAGLVDFIPETHEIMPGVTIRSLRGHTPGQIGLFIQRGGQTALFVGDAIHHPVQIIAPEWSSSLCADQDEARRTRIAFLEEAADTGMLLVPGHFRCARACHIGRGAQGFRLICD